MLYNNVCENYKYVREGVIKACQKAGRSPEDVTLIAVSKGHSADKLLALAAGGVAKSALVYGESYVQEALAKQKEVAEKRRAISDCPRLLWHFIGHIQSRKAKDIMGHFSLIHSVDSIKIAKNLDKSWHEKVGGISTSMEEGALGPQRILIQVNIGKESQKSGVMPEDAQVLVLEAAKLPGLLVEGLMCLPPACETAEEARPYFAALAKLKKEIQMSTGLSLPHLSMGMSHDFMVAIEEGATMVRVGTDIFGEREKKE